MSTDAEAPSRRRKSGGPYVLDEQIGFILRQVSQRHGTIFASLIGDDLTPTQWAALAKLVEIDRPCSQNLLGRHTAMDVATIKGVVDRLAKRGLICTMPDPEDGRRLLVDVTDGGRELVDRVRSNAERITKETLAPLNAQERETLLDLLKRLR